MIERLRSDDPARINDAVAELHPELRAYAAREVSRTLLRSRDPDTIVDSVLMRCLRVASDRCASDGELRGYLLRSIRNAVIDEARKRRPSQFPEDASEGFCGIDDDPTPLQMLVEQEAERIDQAAFARFERTIAGADLTPRERQLIECFVLRGMAWEHVAATLGLSGGAARTAMSRLRSTILPILLGEMKELLAEADWAVLESVMIQRVSPERTAERLGIDPLEVMDRFTFSVVPAIERTFGRRGMAMLRRLLHKPARDAGVARPGDARRRSGPTRTASPEHPPD